MTMAVPAARRIFETTNWETLLIRPWTTCWANTTAPFQRVTKMLAIPAAAPTPDAGVSRRALNTPSMVSWTKLEMVEQGASKKPIGCATAVVAATGALAAAGACPPARGVLAIKSDTKSGRAIVGNVIDGARRQS